MYLGMRKEASVAVMEQMEKTRGNEVIGLGRGQLCRAMVLWVELCPPKVHMLKS